MKKPYSKIIGGLSLAVLLTGVTGCETMNKHDERSEGRLKDDKNITASVKSRLKDEPVYKFNDVNVNTFAGVVQLSGFVSSEDQARRAQEIAARTAGVHQVVNGLTLKQYSNAPTGQTDGAGQSRIYAEPPSRPYQTPKAATQDNNQSSVQRDTTEQTSEPK